MSTWKFTGISSILPAHQAGPGAASRTRQVCQTGRSPTNHSRMPCLYASICTNLSPIQNFGILYLFPRQKSQWNPISWPDTLPARHGDAGWYQGNGSFTNSRDRHIWFLYGTEKATGGYLEAMWAVSLWNRGKRLWGWRWNQFGACGNRTRQRTQWWTKARWLPHRRVGSGRTAKGWKPLRILLCLMDWVDGWDSV